MKRYYRKLSSVSVSIDLESPILIQSGELGARIYIAPSVEEWVDSAPSFDAYIDPENHDKPLEF